jgi:hypothetical protein
MGVGRSESVEQVREQRSRYQNFGDWRGIISAWAIALFIVMLFAGVQAVASLRGMSPHQASLAGTVIPQHDPACAGPVVPNAAAYSQCHLPDASFDRGNAGSYAYALW